MESKRPARRLRQIGLAQARRAYDQHRGTVFVDVRSRFAYDRAHVLGAVSLPLDAIESQWEALSPDQALIIYSDSPDDTADEMAATFLMSRGFTRLSVLREGFAGWDDAGHPVGTEPFPEEVIGIKSDFAEGPS